jgi:hypothetical protein
MAKAALKTLYRNEYLLVADYDIRDPDLGHRYPDGADSAESLRVPPQVFIVPSL